LWESSLVCQELIFQRPQQAQQLQFHRHSIGQLLHGVIAAMVASLVGLAFTVISIQHWHTSQRHIKMTPTKIITTIFLQRELLAIS
jgi:uncharacterized membrane protein (DUF373 family)